MKGQTTRWNKEASSNNKSKKYLCLHFNGNYNKQVSNRFKKFDLAVEFKTFNTLLNILHPKKFRKNSFCYPGVYQINFNE